MTKRTSVVRTYASRAYHQRKQRQQRIILLGLAGLLFLLLVAGALWGAFYMIPRVLVSKPVSTKAFTAFMDREFGLSTNPSLLYYQNLNYALLRQSSPDLFKDKLIPILPTHEDIRLKRQLEQLFAQYPAQKFIPHFYFYNPQNGTYVEFNGYSPVAAASVIKLPILLDYMISLDENLITLTSPLLYAEFHRAGGSGGLQYQPAGQNLSANEVATQMIAVSDNTCTNMMISYLGGTDAVNQRLADLGLVHTRIRNWLPDLTGTNTISAYEMVTILKNIDHGPIVSEMSRYNGLNILKSTHNRRLLVWLLPREAMVAHKTGDIGTSLGDSGVIYMPDGRKYFVSMQVERPFNDYTAQDMMQKASRLIYDYVATQPDSHDMLNASI